MDSLVRLRDSLEETPATVDYVQGILSELLKEHEEESVNNAVRLHKEITSSEVCMIINAAIKFHILKYSIIDKEQQVTRRQARRLIYERFSNHIEEK